MKKILTLILLITLISCSKKEQPAEDNSRLQDSVQAYLDGYNVEIQKLVTKSSEAEWLLNTKIIEGDTITGKLADKANEDYAKFTGSVENITTAKGFLGQKDKLTGLQARQLDAIIYTAGRNPAIADSVVREKIKADTKQTKDLFGFEFQIDDKPVSANDIDKILDESSDLADRLKAWESSKEVGKGLKQGLLNLRHLRNASVQALDYSDFFAYEVSDYGMTVDEMRQVCQNMIKDIWPLYRELHTWARYTLAEKYGKDVPDMLPAHWLPNRWGQDWTALVNVEGMNIDDVLKDKPKDWIIKEGERFYVSLGLDSLPESFYERSSLYPLPDDAGYKKNNHASAWHINLNHDLRSLMSIVNNTRWWGTALHELGHIYYFSAYSNPDVPIVLRNGANRAYHEAIGSLLGLAALQKPFLSGLGLIKENTKTDETMTLLKEALEYIVFIPWSAGVMTDFEWDLYSNNLDSAKLNKKWWNLKKKYQGIVPPAERGEEFCDASSKTHINNDAAQYYDYAISYVLLFQFHDYIAKNILKQDPHATNYWGSKETGKFLYDIMKTGASVDWRELLHKSIGSGLSAKPMVDYFAPLMDYLKEQNKGRKYTLPEYN